MFFDVPLPTTERPHITQTTALEGQDYKLTFTWNSRTDRWTFALATEAGIDIITGALLSVGTDLLRTIPSTQENAPPGNLILFGEDDPTLDTIGEVSLVYIPSE